MDVRSLLSGYDQKKISVAVLGGHSALDVCHGAKQNGFQTLAVVQKGRSRTYDHHYRTRVELGCVDECFEVNAFQEVLEQ